MCKKTLWSLVLFILFVTSGLSAVELPPVIGSNMVVQCVESVAFWGWADEGEEVIIRQGGEVLATTTGAGGKARWKVLLPAFQAGPVKDIEALRSNTLKS